jgi:L-asparaginase
MRAARDVLVLATGGTIAMAGARAVPSLDADALVAAVPGLAEVPGLRARELWALPGAHLPLDAALQVAREAAAAAREGTGVVVTHGTDTLEETAMLCDLMLDADAPVVLTGAIRPGSAAGADGPANLLDAVAVAAAPEAAGFGAIVVFGGEVHAARHVRKVDSTSPVAFGSPATGPIGRVVEGRPALHLRPVRPDSALAVSRLDFRVPVVATALGDDGALLQAAVRGGADGIVLVTLGGGHVAPEVLRRVRDAAQQVPLVLAVRPERGAFLAGTYGFEGAEEDLRATGAVPAGVLSPQAARMKLLACLGAGLDAAGVAAAFAADGP